MPSAYRPNSAGFRAIANGPEVRRALAEVAGKGKAFAESVSQEFRDTGEYAQSFAVRETTVEWAGSHPGPRAAVELANTAGHAAAVEYGYEGRSGEPSTSAHRVLGRTLEFLESEGRA